jgi:hypothetical protein
MPGFLGILSDLGTPSSKDLAVKLNPQGSRGLLRLAEDALLSR